MTIFWSIASLVLLAVGGPAAQERYDLLIRGGRIVDGTGNPWYRADVGVRDGRIVSIGDLARAQATRVVEARGRVVAPGFIDMHNHADGGLVDPDLRYGEAFLHQGVTTSVVGVDGRGADDVAEQAAPILAHGIAGNLAFYVGHNAARRRVMGIANRAPTSTELQRMKAFIRRGMESGAFGISTGLQYIPGRYSDTSEVIELSTVAAELHGIYDTHYRDEFNNMLQSIREGIEISEKAGLAVHFGHIKVIGEHNWGKMPDAVALIAEARRRGLDITADQYPWENGAVSELHGHVQIPPSLKALHAVWRRASGFDEVPQGSRREHASRFLAELRKALQAPEARAAIRRATEQGLEGPEYNNWIRQWGYDWFRVVRTRKHPEYLDQTITQIAYWKGTSGFDILADLIVEEGEDVGVSMGPFSPDDVHTAMVEPWVAISTDGTLGPFGEGFPHPRSYGSYARLIEHYVREKGLLTLEEAVRKATSLPAQTLGLRDRGLLREGAWADITVFDPAAVRNRSTYADPHHYAQGFDLVALSGTVVLEEGKPTGATPGRVLRHRLPDLGPGP